MNDQKVCRLCLEITPRDDITIRTTFPRWEEKTIWDVLVEILDLKQLEHDPLPKTVCVDCFMKLDQYYEFHQQILSNDKTLKKNVYERETLVKFEEEQNLLKPEKLENLYYDDDDVGEPNDQVLDDDNNFIKDDCSNDSDFKVDIKDEEIIEKTDLKENLSSKRLKTSKKFRNSSRNLISKKIKQLSKTSKKTKKSRKCFECNKTFKRKACYDSHMLKHYGQASFACEFCPKKFVRGVSLTYHRRTHTGEKPYICSICSKDFKTPSELHAHKLTHSGEKRFKCSECDATFRSNEVLKNHIRRHTGERPFLCEICSKGFVSKAMLATHIKTAHNEKETCPICQKQITCLGLKKHLQRHKNQDQGIKNYTCELCGKGFSEAATRRKHMLIHTGEKPFACEVCGKRFTQKSTLTNHSRIHSDVLPFLCNFCEKGFRYKHHLRNHITVHHKEMQLSEKTEQGLEDEDTSSRQLIVHEPKRFY